MTRFPAVSYWRRGGLLFVDGVSLVEQLCGDTMSFQYIHSNALKESNNRNGECSSGSLVGRSSSDSLLDILLPRVNNHRNKDTTASHHTRTFASRHMSTATQTPNKKRVVELTESALKRMQVLVQGHPKGKGDTTYIRLGVKRRGCNGLAYTLQYDTEKKKFDEEVDYSLEGYDGVKVLIDAGAIMHVLGTRMDFVEDDVRSEFVFVNPNASGTCGCGESFTTDSDEFATNSKKNQ